MERLWAYKRINYLLDTPALSDPTKPSCEKGIDETPLEYSLDIKIPDNFDRCEKEAVRLALKFNFVTDLTSMVVEETDEYTTKRNLEEKKVQPKDDNQYSYGGHSPPPQSNGGNRISYNPNSKSNHNPYPYPTYKSYNPSPKPYNPYPTHKPYNPYPTHEPYNPYPTQKDFNPYSYSTNIGSRTAINHIPMMTITRYAEKNHYSKSKLCGQNKRFSAFGLRLCLSQSFYSFQGTFDLLDFGVEIMFSTILVLRCWRNKKKRKLH